MQTFSRQHAAVRNRSGAMLREKQTIDIFFCSESHERGRYFEAAVKEGAYTPIYVHVHRSDGMKALVAGESAS